MLEPVVLEAEPPQGAQVGELEAAQPPDAVVLEVEGVEVGEAVEGLVAHGLDAGGVQEEAGDALAADEGLTFQSASGEGVAVEPHLEESCYMLRLKGPPLSAGLG